MKEILRLLGLNRKPPVEGVPRPMVTVRGDRYYNSSFEPDRARLDAIWYTPGVLRGTLLYQTKDGVEVVDFDERDEQGRPTHKSYPGANIIDFEAK